jgi:hypothetical protein
MMCIMLRVSALAFMTAAMGCGKEDIPLATLDSGLGESGAGDAASMQCTTDTQCIEAGPGNWFCQKNCPSFFIPGQGLCEPVPEHCADAGTDPVCACDGTTTYLNLCLARHYKAGIAYPGNACPTLFSFPGCGQSCNGTCVQLFSTFPTPGLPNFEPMMNAFCAFPEGSGSGSCWVLSESRDAAPPACSSGGPRTYLRCGTSEPPCVDPCTAINDGGVFLEDIARCRDQ